MSEKVKAKKAKAVAKKKSKSIAKKKSASPKKREKTPVAKKANLSRSVKKANIKKKTTKNVIEEVESEVRGLGSEEVSPPLEERFFDSKLDLKEDLNLKDHTIDKGLGNGAVPDDSNVLSVKLSNSLHKKLKKQAADEGVSLEDFVSELLAESVVLRAWEIVERKSQMRSTPSQNVHNRSGNTHNTQSGNNRNNRKGRMSHGRYQSIMDDKATFLEYVRNQERSRR